jgi:hypothetical protein
MRKAALPVSRSWSTAPRSRSSYSLLALKPGLLLAFVLGLTVLGAAAAERDEDHRAWQHGIDLIRAGGRLLVVWGSPGNPPLPNVGGDWQHDVYYAWLDAPAAGTRDSAPIEPQILVSRPEAQEPPSVAINARGNILMTTEDGNGGINQHAGLWDASLRVLRNYPFIIKRGGHSGHAAAMGDRFLVAYGEGWVDGGGWRGLGTGKNVLARVVGNDGKLGHEIRLTSVRDSHPRDTWPVVAGSDRNWLVVWQRYPELTLQAALIDAAGSVIARRRIADRVQMRYAYDVEFAPQLGLYVVAGSADDGAFISLLSLGGQIVSTTKGLPPMAAESRIVLGGDGAQQIGVYPVQPQGVAVVRLTAHAIELVKVIDHPYAWDYAGTSGIFLTPGRVLFATLSTTGLHLIAVDLGL